MQALFGNGNFACTPQQQRFSFSSLASGAQNGVVDGEASAAQGPAAADGGKLSLRTARGGVDALSRNELLVEVRLLQQQVKELERQVALQQQKRLDELKGAEDCTGGYNKKGCSDKNVRVFGKIIFDSVTQTCQMYALSDALFKLSFLNCVNRSPLMKAALFTVDPAHKAYAVCLKLVMQPTVSLVSQELHDTKRLSQFQIRAKVSDTGMALMRNVMTKSIKASEEDYKVADSDWRKLGVHKAREVQGHPGLIMPSFSSARDMKNLRLETRLLTGLSETGDGQGGDFSTFSKEHVLKEMTKVAQSTKLTTIMEHDGESREVFLVVNFQDAASYIKGKMQTSTSWKAGETGQSQKDLHLYAVATAGESAQATKASLHIAQDIVQTTKTITIQGKEHEVMFCEGGDHANQMMSECIDGQGVHHGTTRCVNCVIQQKDILDMSKTGWDEKHNLRTDEFALMCR
jgi:hypothetical protein